MNRKILEDIKLNNKILKTPKEDVVYKDVHISTPVSLPSYSIKDDSTKYDFLKKKNKVPTSTKRIPDTPKMPSNSKRFNKTILFIFILSLFIGTFYLLETTFFKAKVTVIAKNKIFEINKEKFTASKEGGIPFEVMIVEDSYERDVVLTSSKEVNDKAKGEITLYNEYSQTAQKVLTGTFISDEGGKSYKIDKTISIPAYTIDKTKKIIPGQATVAITSFLAGETYNGSPLSFYINSFKGTDKYKKIYGKIKTPLTGGMVGLVYTLDDKEKEVILSNVSSFKDRLLRKLNALVPEGYLLYPDAVNFSYLLGENIISKTPNTKIAINGTISAFLVNKSDLTSSIINRMLPDISLAEKSEIIEPDLSLLSFNFINKEQVINKEIGIFDFNLNGNLTLNWAPDINKLKGLLVSKNKTEVPAIFKQDPGITSASVSIIPFWSKKLPSEEGKISIILK